VSRYGTGAVNGHVRMNSLTIGNGSSSATERANADTANLFIFIYLNSPSGNGGNGDGGGIVSGGARTAPGNTRAAAISDFNANKTITLPDFRGRTEFGLDDMGAASAARLNSVASTTFGTATGSQYLMVHNHGTSEPSHHHGGVAINAGGGTLAGSGSFPINIGNSADATTGLTITNAGAGTATNAMPPSVLVTKYIAL
jgi:hypothetical protein